MHCEIGGTQGPLGYVSALGATRLVHWLILVASSCLRSHNARYIMLKSLSMGIVQVMGNQPWQVCNQMFVCKRKRVLKTSWSLNPTKGILIQYLNPTWCEWSLWWMIDLNIQCIYSMYIIQRFVGYCQPRKSVTPNVSAMHLQIVALCYQGHL